MQSLFCISHILPSHIRICAASYTFTVSSSAPQFLRDFRSPLSPLNTQSFHTDLSEPQSPSFTLIYLPWAAKPGASASCKCNWIDGVMWKFEFQELATRLPDVVDKKVSIIRHFTQDALSRLRTVSLYQSTYHRQMAAARADKSFATEAAKFTRRLGSSGSKVTVPGSDTGHHKTVAVQLNGVRTSAMTEMAGCGHSFARSTLPLHTHAQFP